jgi:hypothetical protein
MLRVLYSLAFLSLENGNFWFKRKNEQPAGQHSSPLICEVSSAWHRMAGQHLPSTLCSWLHLPDAYSFPCCSLMHQVMFGGAGESQSFLDYSFVNGLW